MSDKNVIILGSNTMIGLSLKKKLNAYLYEHIEKKKYRFNFIDKNIGRDKQKLENIIKQFSDIADNTIVVNLEQHKGGILKNLDHTLEMYMHNLEINYNIITLCYKYNIKRFINILPTCMYGDDISFPIEEDQIEDGYPHFSNLGYSSAMKNSHILTTLINLEKYFSYVNLITTDVFGEYDNYNLSESTVIPSIIHKAYLAAKKNKNTISLLGNGKPERMFIYVDDLASVIIDFIFKFKEKGNFIVSGSVRKKINIDNLASLISEKVTENGYIEDLDIIFDNKEDFNGQLVRTCNNQKIKKLYNKYDLEYPVRDRLEHNINKVIKWFWNNYVNHNKI